MGKVVNRAAPSLEDFKAGRTEGPLYDRATQLYPVEALPPNPVMDPRTQKLVNYNWVMAKTIQALKQKLLNRDEAIDVMFKAEELLDLSYTQVYGKHPLLPEVKASGK